MNSPSKPRATRWQFGLSTLLCVMTACAGVAWLWRPQPPETTEDSGLRVQARRVTVEREATGGKGFFHGQPTQKWEQEVVAGPLRLRDAFGRVLLYGETKEGVPTATWRLYHNNGRVAQRADLADGKFAGKLIAYDERGAKVAELSLHGNAALELTWPHDPLGYEAPLSPLREGEVRAWWPNGKLRHRGQFADDLATGSWEFFSEDGTLQAEGSFRRGLRAGEWKVRDGESLVNALFAAGVQIEKPQARLQAALLKLKSNAANEQLAAVRELGRLGSISLPTLTELLRGDDSLLTVAALQSLAEFSGEGAPLAEMHKLVDAADPGVRIAAQIALVDLDPEAELAVFRELLLAAQAQPAQARLRSLTALRGLTQRHLSACETMLSDDDLKVRYAAVWLLTDCVEQLRNEVETGQQAHVVVALKEMAKRAAKSEDPWVRKAATEIMIWIDTPPSRGFIGVTSVVPVVGG
jgi:hypothetical protein